MVDRSGTACVPKDIRLFFKECRLAGLATGPPHGFSHSYFGWVESVPVGRDHPRWLALGATSEGHPYCMWTVSQNLMYFHTVEDLIEAANEEILKW